MVFNKNKIVLNLTDKKECALGITVKPTNDTNKRVRITSSDNNVVTIDNKDVITAVGEGEATITGTCGEITTSCIAQVINVEVEGEDVEYTSDDSDNVEFEDNSENDYQMETIVIETEESEPEEADNEEPDCENTDNEVIAETQEDDTDITEENEPSIDDNKPTPKIDSIKATRAVLSNSNITLNKNSNNTKQLTFKIEQKQ